MTQLTPSQLRDDVTSAIRRVSSEGERILVQRNRKGVAALVSVEDLALLEEIENRLDLAAYRKAKGKFKDSGGKSVPFEQVCREMGL